MKILFLSVPRVIYSKSLNNRATDFGETIAFVKQRLINDGIGTDIQILDASAPMKTTKVIYKEFKKRYDVVVFYVDVADAPIVLKLARRLSVLSPATKIFVYGDATITIPQFFEREPFDALHITGDQEYCVYSYMKYVYGNENDVSLLAGISINIENTFIRKNNAIWLDGEEWAFPPVDMLPVQDYDSFSKINKNANYCMSVYASKGCKNNCNYCLCVPREGNVDRRRPVKLLVDFMEKYMNDFREFKLHSANLFVDREWTMNFAEELITRSVNVKWRATTEFQTLDEELVRKCVASGCSQISFGVESFFRGKDRGVKFSISDLNDFVKSIEDVPVKLKGYIMLGLPNQTLDDVYYTIEVLQGLGIKVRPSTFTPFHLLTSMSTDELDRISLENWNKKEFIWDKNNVLTEKEVYQILGDLLV